MLFNLKKCNKISYCNINELKIKILKSFILKINLHFSVHLKAITDFSWFIFYLSQLNNFCNYNKKFRSVFRFFRLNRFSLLLFFKAGLIKNSSKSS
jgi:hypothetical protein